MATLRNKTIFTVLISFFSFFSFGQNNQNLADQIQLAKKIYSATDIDSLYGIIAFEKYNPALKGDEVRYCKGYACQNWVKDKYENGQLIHKGYYVDGQLRIYKNYFQNGNLERQFKQIDNFTSTLKLYHKNGQPKSVIKYVDGEAQEWTDFYDNGNVEYKEFYNRTLLYHKEKSAFYKDGSPQDILLLVSKKKLQYEKSAFYENGSPKIEGKLVFSKATFDYQKSGTWKYFGEDGSLKAEISYSKGKAKKTKKIDANFDINDYESSKIDSDLEDL